MAIRRSRGLSNRSTGFTLVEVLVALVIMAAIAVMAWRGIDGMLRSREISQASLQRSERLQTVLVQWEQDLRMLQDSELNTVPPLTFDGSTLRILRRQAEGLQLVAWTLREGRLYRWESAALTTQQALIDALTRSQQGLEPQTRQLVALEGLSGWQMFFYRGNAWSNAQSSDDVAQPSPPPANPPGPNPNPNPNPDQAGPNSSKHVLPSGVRMILQFAPGGGFDGPLTRQILLGPQT
ncbi:prepilin-type N-terminal cleavage/methylation domain-containing protein [Roseateles sp. DAIF2]|nr:prepilin-type N-terminal cleavage/methylation domain-containing protein [Roseateles sp. DAIF2]